MKKFEYKVLNIISNYRRNYLNEEGEKGWELVAVENGRFYFKREVITPSKEFLAFHANKGNEP